MTPWEGWHLFGAGMDLRRVRRLNIMGKFRNSDVGLLFSDDCLVFLQRIRALLEVVVV